MLQSYILANRNRGAVILRAIAISAARALTKKFPNFMGQINI